VVRRGSRGHCTYDEVAKRELIELCRRGVASVAKVALTYGVNPNVLHNWMARDRKECAVKSPDRLLEEPRNPPSAFIPVFSAPVAAVSREIKLDITLANGILQPDRESSVTLAQIKAVMGENSDDPGRTP
jgi:transposase-like protein